MIVFGKSGAEVVEESQKDILEKLLNESEMYFVKTISQVMSMGATGLVSELDSDQVKLLNDALGYWARTKKLTIAAAELQDKRDEELRSNLEKLQKEQEKTNKLLEEISRRKDK